MIRKIVLGSGRLVTDRAITEAKIGPDERLVVVTEADLQVLFELANARKSTTHHGNLTLKAPESSTNG